MMLGDAPATTPDSTPPPVDPFSIPCPLLTNRDSLGGCNIWGSRDYQKWGELGALAIIAAFVPAKYKVIPLGLMIYGLAKPGSGPLVSFQ